MTEKLKIYVTARIAEILTKDAEGFEFFKKDGRTLNKNALLTKLVVNYHTQFAKEQEEMLAFLTKRMPADAAKNESRLNALCFDVCERINERNAAPDGEKFNALVSLKPTRESEPVLDFIERYELAGRTLSEYFRSMFASYAALPQDKREEIIFKPQYDAIMKAIKEKKKIFLTMNNNRGTNIETSPYALSRSKEELHVYLIAAGKACTTVRLSRIASVRQLTADATFSEQQIKTAEKMIAYGAQFPYRPDEETVVVELTPKGIDKFKKIYVHRPIPSKVENNRYYFDCSYIQIVQYFIRFGSDAKILSPQCVINDVCSFYRRALNRYEKQS